MKTRSAPVEAPNIAAIVKARHHARVLCPISESVVVGQQSFAIPCGPLDGTDTSAMNLVGAPGVLLGVQAACDEPKAGQEEKRSRADSARPVWSIDERRLFFQAVRLYGRNFTEIARFIRSRGHRLFVDWSAGLNTGTIADHSGSAANPGSGIAVICSTPAAPNSVSAYVASQSGCAVSTAAVHPTTTCSSINDLNAPCGGPTREQVRFFYQRTWQKIRRYVKFPEEVPQHAREVYALVNYSVIRTRIKKPLDHRLGEKLNELVHCGTTVIRHNGRRFLLRTPVCQALKQLNHVTAPNHEFLLPEDIWVELVPSTQSDLWRVIEAEQNPRLRLRVDINRQLSDVIGLVENKWQRAAERLQTLFGLPSERECKPPRLLVRITPTQTVDGAIRLQEVARIRSGDMALRAYLERIRAAKPGILPQNPSAPPVQSTGLGIIADSNSGEPPSTWSSDFSRTVKEVPLDVQVESTNSLLPTSVGTQQAFSSPGFSVPSGSTVMTTTQSSTATTAELDLRETGKQLIQGVCFQAARGIKLLTIFLALGCPDRIRFEYAFVAADEKDAPPTSQSSCDPVDQTNLITCPINDADGQGISNGLRRLLHLNASDYLLHREWAFRQSVLNTPAIAPIQPKSIAPSSNTAANRTPVVTTRSPATPVPIAPARTESNDAVSRARPNNTAAVVSTSVTSASSKPRSITAINTTACNPSSTTTLTASSSTCNTTASSFITPIPVQSGVSSVPVHPFLGSITALPTSVLKSTTEAVQFVVADAFSVTDANTASTAIPTRDTAGIMVIAPAATTSTTNSQVSMVTSSTCTTPIINAIQGSSPSLIVLPKTVSSKVAVVERRLDIPQNSSGTQTRVTVASKPPLPPTHSVQQPAVHLPRVTIPNTPLSRLIALQPRPPQSVVSAPSTGTAEPKQQSSLSAVKAFNSKRRRTNAVRGPRRAGGSTAADAKGSTGESTCSFSTSLSSQFSNAVAGSTQLPIGLPLLIAAPGPGNRTPSTTTTAVSASTTSTATVTTTATRSGILPASAALIQGFSSLTPTVSVLNASSLLFGDGDTSLGTLLDTGGSNQSTISAMSHDTLASLLNTICHSAALPLVDTGLSGLSQTQTGTEPNRRRDNHVGSSETVIPCKCEDPTEQRTDWNDISRLDFQTIGRFCPSSSTPHLPPSSPAFADISLTDSMAAAVMDTHEGDLEVDDYADCQVPSFPVVLQRGLSNSKEFLEMNGSSSGMPVVYTSSSSTDISSSTAQSFMRVMRASSSNEIATIDLNSLMRTMNQHTPENSPPSME